MIEHPILFSAPMVKAIMAGHKTQARRLIRPQPERVELHNEILKETKTEFHTIVVPPGWQWKNHTLFSADCSEVPFASALVHHCPYGNPGHQLWVRETWYCDHFRCTAPRGRFSKEEAAQFIPHLEYRASHDCGNWEAGCPCADDDGRGSWVPSIHMPRWASRIQLELTAVRVEQLQEITVDDVIAEGIAVPDVDYTVPERPDILDHERECWARGKFHQLWDQLNLKRAPWTSNPWVWCLEFRRIDE